LVPHLFLDGGRLRGRAFFVEVRRARLAQTTTGVPAVLRADPVAASRALFEVLPGFLDGLPKRDIVLLAADRALDLVRRVSRLAEDAAEQLAGAAQQRAGSPDFRLDEVGHVPVAALVAEELELVTEVGRQILMVFGEGYEGHGLFRVTTRGRTTT